MDGVRVKESPRFIVPFCPASCYVVLASMFNCSFQKTSEAKGLECLCSQSQDLEQFPLENFFPPQGLGRLLF